MSDQYSETHRLLCHPVDHLSSGIYEADHPHNTPAICLKGAVHRVAAEGSDSRSDHARPSPVGWPKEENGRKVQAFFLVQQAGIMTAGEFHRHFHMRICMQLASLGREGRVNLPFAGWMLHMHISSPIIDRGWVLGDCYTTARILGTSGLSRLCASCGVDKYYRVLAGLA